MSPEGTQAVCCLRPFGAWKVVRAATFLALKHQALCLCPCGADFSDIYAVACATPSKMCIRGWATEPGLDKAPSLPYVRDVSTPRRGRTMSMQSRYVCLACVVLLLGVTSSRVAGLEEPTEKPPSGPFKCS